MDKIPALLNGDFTINPVTAKRFYDQLKAINEGRSVVYTDGPKEDAPRPDAREAGKKLAFELKRRLRRK